jgi:hypothetical protein
MSRTNPVRNVCEIEVMGCALTDSLLEPVARSETREAERAVRCGGCGRSYGPGAWRALPIVSLLTIDAISAHVVKWPHGVRIEVRRCTRCARSMARTERIP